MYATPTAVQGRRIPGEQGLHVSFFTEAVESELKSKEQGHPVFDDVEMIEIRIPGDEKTIIRSLVTEEYRARFPDEYDAFKKNVVIADSGTPLEQWAHLKPSQIASLKGQNFRTVEDIVHASDANIQKVMGGNELRQKAKTYLQAATDAAALERANAEKAELLARIEALEAKKK